MTICARPDGQQTTLGEEGAYQYIAVNSEVYLVQGCYWRGYCALRCWPTSGAGKRIAEREGREARERQRLQAAMVAEERRRLHGRRVR